VIIPTVLSKTVLITTILNINIQQAVSKLLKKKSKCKFTNSTISREILAFSAQMNKYKKTKFHTKYVFQTHCLQEF
jgi:hypothetical protein